MSKTKKQKTTDDNTYAKTADVPEDRERFYQELTQQQPVYSITMEEAPVTVDKLIPDYRYKFDGTQSASGESFIGEFRKFLDTNAYLVLDSHPSREFADGFARAVAVTALYLDSLELQSKQKI